jgi:DNA topoisomerase IB
VARLRRSDCSKAGLARRRHGRGFVYLDERGRRVAEPAVLDRIRALAIPPAWSEVWICADPLGHLQATGIDAAGRKQYLYHERWRARRDQEKFDAMLGFARSLPALRRRVDRTLRGGDGEPSRERVLACAARLLDLGFFRIGSEVYAEDNRSFGLATILKQHVSVDDGQLLFDYPAKSGQRRVQAIADPLTTEIVTTLKRRRGGGEALLAYRNGRRWHDLRSDDINDYLKEQIGEEFSAKDFRTWNATVLAAVTLGAADAEQSRRGRERAIGAAVKGVAHYLGNTPAVCRSAYIDPRVFDRYRSGETIAATVRDLADDDPLLANRSARQRVEAAVIDLLTAKA